MTSAPPAAAGAEPAVPGHAEWLLLAGLMAGPLLFPPPPCGPGAGGRVLAVALAVGGLLSLMLPLRAWIGRTASLVTPPLLLYATPLLGLVASGDALSAALLLMACLAVRCHWQGQLGAPGWPDLAAGGLAGTAYWLSPPAAALALPPLVASLRPVAWLRAGLVLAGLALGLLLVGAATAGLPPSPIAPLAPSLDGLLDALWGPRGGLLYWAPLLWGGVLGLLVPGRGPRPAAPLGAAVVAVVGWGAAGDPAWSEGAGAPWGVTAVALLAPALGVALAATARLAARRPALPLGAAAGMLILWNLLFIEQYHRERIPRDLTVSFANVTRHNAQILTEWAGAPPTWPASWLFRWRFGVPALRYEAVAAWRLPQREEVVLDFARAPDSEMLDDGWSDPARCGAGPCRSLMGRGRLFLSLRAPETLVLALRAAGSGTLSVSANGAVVAWLALQPEPGEHRARLHRRVLRAGINEVALAASDRAVVERIALRRLPGPEAE